MRKLASVQKVLKLSPIKGADRIEVATINGWDVVVQKGLHKEGDLVCYFEVDSFLPIKDQYQLPENTKKNTSNLGEGYRIKSIRLRKQLSQGFIMPLSELEEVQGMPLEEGRDLTELLGVQKWELPIPAEMSGRMKGNFPTLIPKTDQERVQNIINKQDRVTGEYLVDGEYEVTLKLDGSSMTVYMMDGVSGACSRNIDLKIDEENQNNVFIKTAKEKDLLHKIHQISLHLGCEVAIQGELMGEGVQGNREQITGHDFFLFDIFNITEQHYLRPDERMKICNKFEIQHVPVVFNALKLDVSQWDSPKELLDNLLGLADRKSITHSIAEGLVFKSLTDSEKSFKVINNKFLLKED